MNPPARDSVKRINTHLWTLGTAMMCVKSDARDASVAHAVGSWEDGGSVFHLIPRDEALLATAEEGDSAIDRIQECGTGGSVWGIGNEAICKVKSWCNGQQLEATTIAFVNEHCPTVPVPKVIYSWIDEPINRTFLILGRVHGRTLNNAWPLLTATQRLNIANEIAQHCSILAQKTSTKYESVSGYGNHEYWLMEKLPASNPSWKTMVLGPFSGDEMHAYMTKISTEPAPDFEPPFLFYHPDLGPTNIMVSEDGNKVAAMIDWEAAGYFPSFWVATKPISGWAFRLSGPNIDAEKADWGKLLVKALQDRGFNCDIETYLKWYGAKTGPA